MLPHVQRQKNKNRRKKMMRRGERDAAELREAHSALIPREPKLSSRRKKQLVLEQRQQERRAAREIKKAEHRLSFFDRLFGVGRGPAQLRAKWMAKLLGE